LLLDGAQPCSTHTSEAVKCKTILFPRDVAVQQFGYLGELRMQRLGRESAVSKLLRTHIGTLYETIPLLEPQDRFTALSATLQLMSICFKPEGSESSHYVRSMFCRVLEWMQVHALEPALSPSLVAQQFGISTRYLQRMFAESGLTFSEWLRNERLNRARAALTNSDHSITEIAYRFGFYDSAHLSNLFKARYGIRPKQFRSKALAGKTIKR